MHKTKHLILIIVLLLVAVVAYGVSSGFNDGAKRKASEPGQRSQVPSILDPTSVGNMKTKVQVHGEAAKIAQKQPQANAASGAIPLPRENTPLRELYRNLKKASAEGDGPAATRLYEDAMSCMNYLRAKSMAGARLAITSDVRKDTDPFTDMTDVSMDNHRRVLGKIDSVLESNAERCDSVDYDFINEIQYKVTLAAAKTGDEDAAACFVSAPFTPGSQALFDEAIIQDYRSHALKFAADGLRNGDWRMVGWVSQAYARADMPIKNQLLYSLVPPDQVAYYAYTLLQRLGANEKSALNLDEFLRGIRASNNFSASQINQAEAWANAMYQQYFSGGPMYDENQPTCNYVSFH